MSENNSENIDQGSESFGHVNALDLSQFSKLVLNDAVQTSFCNLILSTEFKPLYNFNEEKADLNKLANVDTDDEIKTRYYYFFVMQYMLRKSYQNKFRIRSPV